MTHDELMRFVAEKLNVDIEAIKEKRYFEPTYPPDSTIASSAFSYQEIVAHYVVKGTKDRFDLTSPELFLKGLEVFKDENLIKKAITCEIDISGLLMMYQWFDDAEADDWIIKRQFTEVKDIPLLFWECWAELEGEQE